MTNPNGGPMYDKDGLPINPQGPTPFAQPGYNPRIRAISRLISSPSRTLVSRTSRRLHSRTTARCSPSSPIAPHSTGRSR